MSSSIVKNLKVALVQSDIQWEQAVENHQLCESLLQGLKSDPDLIVLPEMFSTGFTMEPAPLAESADGPTLAWMKSTATELQATICGSVVTIDQGAYYNRLYWVDPQGKVQSYDKRHLFRMAGEDEQYQAGSRRLIVDCKGWKLCPMICYDLRFPVWSRNRQDYDCLLFVANWPKVRDVAWSKLLQARAIENLSYVLGVNRVGVDGNGLVYSGRSSFIDFRGDLVKELLDEQGVIELELNREQLDKFRNKFPAHLDADQFSIEHKVLA